MPFTCFVKISITFVIFFVGMLLIASLDMPGQPKRKLGSQLYQDMIESYCEKAWDVMLS